VFQYSEIRKHTPLPVSDIIKKIYGTSSKSTYITINILWVFTLGFGLGNREGRVFKIYNHKPGQLENTVWLSGDNQDDDVTAAPRGTFDTAVRCKHEQFYTSMLLTLRYFDRLTT